MFRRRNDEVRRTGGQADPRRITHAETENNNRDVLIESENIERKIISAIVQTK